MIVTVLLCVSSVPAFGSSDVTTLTGIKQEFVTEYNEVKTAQTQNTLLHKLICKQNLV